MRKKEITFCWNFMFPLFISSLFVITAYSQTGNELNKEIRHWPSAPYAKQNDTRYAGGLSQSEVLTLQQELRGLVNINEAPSARELEIWKQLLKPQWGAFPFEELRIVNGEIYREGHMNDEHWGLGSKCMKSAVNLYRFDDQSYLPIITQYADVMLSSINDEITGHFSEEDGARPPLFIRLMPVLNEGEQMWQLLKYLRKREYDNLDDQAKHDELIARPQALEYEFLFHGHLLQGVANAIVWILDHPEVHNLEAPKVPGVKFSGGITYLEKAEAYLMVMKKMYDYIEQQQYFDKKLGVWMRLYDKAKKEQTHTQGEDGTWDIQYRSQPLNRFMIFNNAYLVTGIALKKLNPEKYGLWHQRAKHVAKRGFDFWREHMVNSKIIQKKNNLPETNEYGKIYYWAYSADYGFTEDHIHLEMELDAMLGINRWEKFFTEEDIKAVSNTVFTQLYDYENHCGFNNIAGECKDTAEWHKVATPWYGAIIGKYMPIDAYEKFMTEQLKQWDNRLKNAELGRSDVYRMPFEILEARLNRFGKDAWLNW